MWMVIGIGLPLLCLTAIENIPARPTANIARHSCPAAIANCGLLGDIEHMHLEAFDAEMQATDSTTSIKIIVEQPLKSAYTLAYLGSPGESKDSWKLLGSLAGMGDYHFTVNEAPHPEVVYGLIFYDVLNDQVLNSITRTIQ